MNGYLNFWYFPPLISNIIYLTHVPSYLIIITNFQSYKRNILAISLSNTFLSTTAPTHNYFHKHNSSLHFNLNNSITILQKLPCSLLGQIKVSSFEPEDLYVDHHKNSLNCYANGEQNTNTSSYVLQARRQKIIV